ncbi:MAG: putative membrane protein, partial [Sphingobacteriales bacterium]
WLIIIATTLGLILSFTKLRSYEDYGASKVGSLFLYVLVASIGMKMNLLAIQDSPGYFLIGLIWMLIHITVLLTTAKIIKAPFFFTAVGSQANVGGAASAPIVASAFHPALASVGVLLAVLGYALGTYAAYFCALLMQAASAGV